MAARGRLQRPPPPRQNNWIDRLTEINLCGVFGEHCTNSGVIHDGRTLQSSYRFVAETPAPQKDYAAAHDSFLDSLLHEQQQLAAEGRRSSQTLTDMSESGLNSSSRSSSQQSVSSWTLSPTSSNSSLMSDNSSRKRRRPVRLHRKASRSPVRSRQSSRPSFSRSDTVNLDDIKETQPPTNFVHSQCRIQKDKGKGDQIGANICAKGVEPCLEKLRAKMQLLTEHCLEEGSTATMKRRQAIVTAEHDNFVETRSLLTLRMGFLSMTYGILLRWDKEKTGKVSLVVLRKNCHESFYNSAKRVSSASSATSIPQVTPSSSMTSEEGLEIAGFNPPYLVSRPDAFGPTEISVSVLYATGLDQKSHWTVQLQLADQTENVLLAFDDRTDLMVPKLGDALTHSVETCTQDLGVLEIKLLEHKLRRKQRVLRCSMRVPCSSLEPQSSDAAVPVTMRIPCPDGATIQIEAVLCSDEAVWQQRELDARRHGSSSSFSARKKSRKATEPEPHEDDLSSPWDWICMVC